MNTVQMPHLIYWILNRIKNASYSPFNLALYITWQNVLHGFIIK
jgi:hypothetical protein